MNANLTLLFNQLQEKEKTQNFNPYHDELGRFDNAPGWAANYKGSYVKQSEAEKQKTAFYNSYKLRVGRAGGDAMSNDGEYLGGVEGVPKELYDDADSNDALAAIDHVQRQLYGASGLGNKALKEFASSMGEKDKMPAGLEDSVRKLATGRGANAQLAKDALAASNTLSCIKDKYAKYKQDGRTTEMADNYIWTISQYNFYGSSANAGKNVDPKNAHIMKPGDTAKYKASETTTEYMIKTSADRDAVRFGTIATSSQGDFPTMNLNTGSLGISKSTPGGKEAITKFLDEYKNLL